jgi:cell division protease FtsH
VHRVSIVSRGRDAAHTDALPRADRVLLTASELRAELTMVMGGAAAELLATGELSTASEADIERATDLARAFCGRYGMSDEVGPVRVVQNDAELFLGRDLLADQHLSSQTLETVDAAVRSLVTSAQDAATALLKRHRAVLDSVADALIEEESLDETTLAALLDVRPPTRVPSRKSAAATKSTASASSSA